MGSADFAPHHTSHPTHRRCQQPENERERERVREGGGSGCSARCAQARSPTASKAQPGWRDLLWPDVPRLQASCAPAATTTIINLKVNKKNAARRKKHTRGRYIRRRRIAEEGLEAGQWGVGPDWEGCHRALHGKIARRYRI